VDRVGDKKCRLIFYGRNNFDCRYIYCNFSLPSNSIFENFEAESYYLLDEEKKNIHQRLRIEFSIGIMILVIGIVLCIFSLVKKTKR
jgi:uncharacterized membrane protein YvbJ